MRSLFAFLFSGLAATSAFGQAKVDKAPGVAVTFTAGGSTDTREDRFVALYVPKGSPATPFVPAGPFKAVFKGDIDSPLRAEYTFIAEVRGQVKVSINGQEVIDAAGA